MRKSYIYILPFLFVLYSYSVIKAQSTFSKVLYDSLQQGIKSHSATSTPDNGAIIVGEIESKNGLIIKIDSTGITQWSKVIDNGNYIYPDVIFNDIIRTKDSSYAIVGRTHDSVTDKSNACIVKINADGNILWAKTVGISGYFASATKIEQTFDLGYILTGNTLYPEEKGFISKFTASGNHEWTKTLEAGNHSTVCNSTKQTSDSGYVLTGKIENYPPYVAYIFLLKLSADGTLTWSKKYSVDSTNQNSGNDVLAIANGFVCYASIDNKLALFKTDSLGNIEWEKFYNHYTGNIIRASHQLSNNSYNILSSYDYCGGGNIINTDSIGIISWARSLNLAAVNLTETTDKGLFITGNGPLCGVKSAAVLSPQIGIIKTDSAGNATNCVYLQTETPDTLSYTLNSSLALFSATNITLSDTISLNSNILNLVQLEGCVDFTGSINDYQTNYNIRISPNPSSGVFVFSCEQTKPYQLNIFNIKGQKTTETKGVRNTVEINLTNQPKGLYFYQAIFEDNKYTTGKLIIE